MAGEDGQEKKHDPSERRLREAAERGELPRSPEISGVGTTIALAMALTLGGRAVADPIWRFVHTAWAPGHELDSLGASALLTAALWAIASSAALPLAAAASVALVFGLAQTRFQIAPRAFEAKLDQLDPFATFQRIYMSRQPFVELAKGLLHVGALGGIAAWAIVDRIDEIPRIATLPPTSLVGLLADLGWGLVIRSVPVMVLLAAIDYGWATYTWWEGMKRTDQEVRDDHKESEGDPYVRALRRRRMREISMANAMAQLKEADVLVTNPTHYAVGLRYRPGKDAAPVVVVKGIDHLALKLRQEAFRLDIPRIEDRALARSLYAQVPQGKAVPAHMYGPVARVLAVVFRRRNRKRR